MNPLCVDSAAHGRNSDDIRQEKGIERKGFRRSGHADGKKGVFVLDKLKLSGDSRAHSVMTLCRYFLLDEVRSGCEVCLQTCQLRC